MKIEREALQGTVKKLKDEGYDYLLKITAVDYSDHLEVLYMLRNMDDGKGEVLEVEIKADDAWMPSIIGYHKAADWYERELGEMFGISIKGRRMERLLLEKWDSNQAPLRKSFVWGSNYKSE